MKSRNNRKSYKKSRKNIKGGFFSSGYKTIPSGECDVNNLSTLSKITGDENENESQRVGRTLERLQSNYQKCCPKNYMGQKNSSPYCRQLDTTYNSLYKHKSDIQGYYGEETDVAKIKEIMNEPTPQTYKPPINPASIPKKKWWQFWGGKKTRRNRKRSYKHRK